MALHWRSPNPALVSCRRLAWVIPWALLNLCGVDATAQTDSQAVATFFPQRLIDESQRDYEAGGPLPFQTFAFVAADLDNDGSSFLVAAYSNGFSGVVRVLERIDGTARVVDEPDLPLMGGIFPSVDVPDVEGDGRPEIAVSYSQAGGSTADWVFRWDGTRLRLIGPVTRDERSLVDTRLSNSSFEDIDGDGIQEIVEPTAADSGAPAWRVYRLEGSQYVDSTSLHFLDSFYINPTTPQAATRGFVVANPGPGFQLTVINGDRDGTNRVTAGTIRLNGHMVVSPAEIGADVRTVVRRVTVLGENRVEVSLVGDVGSWVLVTIELVQR
jgi:hypothetical protein